MTKPKPKAARHRSALSNGSTLFLGAVDGRSEAGRRFADLVADLTAERGGRDALSVAQAEAIRTYAGLAILRDRMQSDLVTSKPVDPEALGQLGDRMARQARIMGPAKPPARPNLRDYAANKGK